MRRTLFAIAACALCTGALASPPYINELKLPVGGAVESSAINPIPKVARGQFLGLACANVERAAADAVRVVLSLAADEPPTGFTGVLATEQTITSGTVHVRVPDLPELAEHTVRVTVFVAEPSGVHTCHAGRMRIV